MDPLSKVLALAKVRGTLFSRASLAAPWGVSTRGTPTAIFHVVHAGGGVVEVNGGAPRRVEAGDLVLLPRGSAHVFRDRPGASVVPLLSLPREEGAGLPRVVQAGRGPRTELLCGTLAFAPAGERWLTPVLPEVIVASSRGATSFLQSTLALLEYEATLGAPGGSVVLERLSEVLLVYVLRAWLAEAGSERRGWVAALGDPHLARLVAAVFAAPERTWSATAMARCAGLSRTALYTRFDAIVGGSPVEWLTSWRMTVAADRLASTTDGIAEVASAVGYASEAAFCRAFRRTYGTSPASVRRAAPALRVAAQ